jgi:hypothetical protein
MRGKAAEVSIILELGIRLEETDSLVPQPLYPCGTDPHSTCKGSWMLFSAGDLSHALPGI